MIDFDEILKKGKSKVKGFDKNSADVLKDYAMKIMYLLHSINNLYGNLKKHGVDVEKINCNDCSKASFILIAIDTTDNKKVLRFHLPKWHSAGKGVYYCDVCRGKAKQ